MAYIKERKRNNKRFKFIICIIFLVLLSVVNNKEEEIYHYQADNESESWYLTLVNRWNPIPADYEVELAEIEGGEKVDIRIYQDLEKMLNDAAEAGYNPIVVSGYRTYETQENLYNEKYESYILEGYSGREAKDLTDQWVAAPGTSEHQTGLAVDINGNSCEIYTWLEENSYRYGFILRYAGEKKSITGIMEEPWHYRYVGYDAAVKIYEGNLCLEEYLILEK